jgi:DNA-binding CsgD family transcriptional regulator
MSATIYIKDDGDYFLSADQYSLFKTYSDLAINWVKVAEDTVDLTPEQQKEYNDNMAKAIGWAKSLKFKPEMGIDPTSFAQTILLHAVKTYDGTKGMAFSSWLYKIMQQQANTLWNKYTKYLEDTSGGERSLAEPVSMPGGEEVELEQLLEGVEQLRAQDDPAYNILRSQLKDLLNQADSSGRLFRIYRMLVEEGLSNPQVASAENLSPSRVTGLVKKIQEVLKNHTDIKELLENGDTSAENKTSAIRRFIFREGDHVNVVSIDKSGIIIKAFKGNVFEVRLDYNNNITRTSRHDLEKYSTVTDSVIKASKHFFGLSIRTPRCYAARVNNNGLSVIAVLEFRPTSETTTLASLYMGNIIAGSVEISENTLTNLIDLVKVKMGVDSKLDPEFLSL